MFISEQKGNALLIIFVPQIGAPWPAWPLPVDMVDTESPICPLSPLETDDLESPLSEEFLQEMGNIQEISQSLGEESSGSFSFTDYQYLGSCPGSESSLITGKCCFLERSSWMCIFLRVFKTFEKNLCLSVGLSVSLKPSLLSE